MPSNLTENEVLLENYYKYLSLKEKKSEHTCRAYLSIAKKIHPKLKNKKKISAQLLRDFLLKHSQECSNSSQALHICALKHFIKWLEKYENKTCPYLEKIKRPKTHSKVQHDIDESIIKSIRILLESRAPVELFLFHLLYDYGLRISEAHSITKKNFKFVEGFLQIKGKGKKIRRLPILQNTKEILSQLKNGSKSWPCHFNVRTLRNWVYRWDQLTFEQSGEERQLHPHRLRHSLATHLLRRGTALPTLQKILGHEHLESTQRYTHLNPSDLKEIYEKSL